MILFNSYKFIQVLKTKIFLSHILELFKLSQMHMLLFPTRPKTSNIFYCCPIKILQKTKNRADFICEVSPFSLDFRRQTKQSNYGQKYTF